MVDAMAPLRAEVMAQPPAERLEYALDLIAFYLDPVPAFFEGCQGMGLELPNAEIRMLAALDVKRGRYVSNNALLAARCLDVAPDEWPSQERVVGGLAMIRKRLKALDLPVSVTTWRGVGYCLDAPEWFRFADGGEALGLVRAMNAGALT